MITTPEPETRTLWGHTPLELHDRYWAALGVQIVRAGDWSAEISRSAELFLLLEGEAMIVFPLRPVLDAFTDFEPTLIRLRVLDRTRPAYAERIVADERGRFVRYERDYRQNRGGDLMRVGLTTDREIAGNWAAVRDERHAWRILTATVSRDRRLAMKTEGVFTFRERSRATETVMRDLVTRWNRPDMTIERIRRWKSEAWADRDVALPETGAASGGKVVGRVWLGAGREDAAAQSLVGPHIAWDDPSKRPETEPLRWYAIEPTADAIERGIQKRSPHVRSAGKRVFDVVFSLLALVCLSPVLPLVMLAILIEDGRPCFFVHRRESIGGREFGCIKFRTMRKDAEAIKTRLMDENEADGPQFYIENDPRITRVGRVLRALQIDELPQFINVLRGDMTIVGPRPSPFSENQYCPGWREARLSMRPGLTGLWQVRRTRAAGTDFQEWIRYDIEYVENASWALDLAIIAQTIGICLKPLLRS